MKYSYRVIILFLLFISTDLYSQFSYNSDHDKKFRFRGKPTIDLSYGVSDITLSGFDPKIANTGMIELRLGYSSLQKTKYASNILKYDNGFLLLSNSSYDLTGNPGSDEIKSTMWKFGFGKREGYGIKFGSFSMELFNSNSFVWSEFVYDTLTTQNNIDYSPLNEFNDAFRFGSATEGGINFQFTPGFSIQPKYEISDIYPRHLFFKQSVSTLIELTGLVLLDTFIKQIMKSSPVPGTIVNFILKNAFEYGMYELRKSDVDWPYSGASPIRYATFKIGTTYTF
ncbi:MAG TPA: hypothetical protein PKD83_03535 [Ignavibacteria bacterium]|nr:hypothetical protein [Ignavibacteria bacterium]